MEKKRLNAGAKPFVPSWGKKKGAAPSHPAQQNQPVSFYPGAAQLVFSPRGSTWNNMQGVGYNSQPFPPPGLHPHQAHQQQYGHPYQQRQKQKQRPAHGTYGHSASQGGGRGGSSWGRGRGSRGQWGGGNKRQHHHQYNQHQRQSKDHQSHHQKSKIMEDEEKNVQAQQPGPRTKPTGTSWAARVGRTAEPEPPQPPSNNNHHTAADASTAVPRTDGFQRTAGFQRTDGFQSMQGFNVNSGGGGGGSGPSKSQNLDVPGVSNDVKVGWGSLHQHLVKEKNGEGISVATREMGSDSELSTPLTTPRSAATSTVGSMVYATSSSHSSAGARLLFKRKVREAAREFFQSFDQKEFARRILVAVTEDGDALRPEVAKITVRLSFDQKENGRKQLVPLFSYLTSEKVLRPMEVFDGLYYFARTIDDVIMDVPDARRMLSDIVAHAAQFGLSPKQLRQLGTVAVNPKPTRVVKDRLKGIIREFLDSNDVREVARSFIEMKAPHFGHQLVKTAVSMAMDRDSKALVHVIGLLKDLHDRKAVKSQEMSQGFEVLLQICEELSVDVLNAAEQLADAIEQAIRVGVLDPAFLRQVHLLEEDKGSSVVEMVRKRLSNSGFATPTSVDETASEVNAHALLVALEEAKRKPSVKKVQIVDVGRETSSEILINPHFGEPVVQQQQEREVAAKTTAKDMDAANETTTTAQPAGHLKEAKSPSSGGEGRPPSSGVEEVTKANEGKSEEKVEKDAHEKEVEEKEVKVKEQASELEGEFVGKWVVPQRRKTSLEDFTLESVVGRGSYGKVFLVRHRKLHTLFAMKVLRKSELIKRDVVDNIQLERRVLETVDHPFLVALRYAFQTPAKLYMVMDYIPGGELFTLLSKKHDLTVKDTRFYAAELVMALKHLHSLNIIYRDLKPENILLHRDGHIALTDFGFAKTDIDVDGKTKSFCGTVDYMAPEVIQKTGHGQGADWWALGVVLYEVAVGRMPFDGGNRKATQHAICHHKLRFPRFFDFDMRMLLQGLLRRNVRKRLGCGKNGSLDIQKHDFFEGINWNVVEKKGLTPPFIPELKNALDVSNFDPEFTREPVVDSDTEYPDHDAGINEPGFFKGFSYDDESPYLDRS